MVLGVRGPRVERDDGWGRRRDDAVMMGFGVDNRAPSFRMVILTAAIFLLGVCLPAQAENDTLRQELEILKQDEAESRARIVELERRLADSEEAREAEGVAAAASDDLWSRQMRGANVRLIDLGLDMLATAGSSTKGGGDLHNLQGGAHDPRQRGFTLNQLELSFQGAVDPYFRAEAYLVFQIDDEGETNTEVEEAFATSQSLPFGLHDLGFEIQAGQFFTEFGRNNPSHPHTWAFVDQPFVISRFLGGDGQRAPGVRVGWLTPLPWFSEIHVGMQNARGETLPSFLANDEVFEERPIGGRPREYDSVHSLDDLVYLARWVNGFDIGEEWSALVGASALFGPNATGSDGRTQIYGADFVAKWQPLRSDRGWPYVRLTTEVLYRRYRADEFSGDLTQDDGSSQFVFIPKDRLNDWGLYSELIWGFRRGWSAGVRYGYGGADGPNYDPTGARTSRNNDPYRSTRHRVSPVLFYDPTEFSRLRLQYNYDHAKNLSGNDAHTVWLGLEISIGAHPVHSY